MLLAIEQGNTNTLFAVHGGADWIAQWRTATGSNRTADENAVWLSQLLAMRAGQPCVVHQVGGLADTVRHHQTGWCFAGADIPAQVHGLVSVFAEACAAVRLQTPSYLAISRACAAERFDWQVAASAYADFYQGLADR